MYSIGGTLADTLDDLISSRRIEPQLAIKIMTNFDKAIAQVLGEKVKARMSFKVGDYSSTSPSLRTPVSVMLFSSATRDLIGSTYLSASCHPFIWACSSSFLQTDQFCRDTLTHTVSVMTFGPSYLRTLRSSWTTRSRLRSRRSESSAC